MLFSAVALFFAVSSLVVSDPVPEKNRGVLQGKLASAYEKEFDSNLPHQDISSAVWNAAGYALFGEGKEGVLIGQEGWLFTAEEFAKKVGAEDVVEKNKSFILSVAEKLLKNNIKLLIVPIPSKARIYKNKLGRYEFPSYWEGQYESLLAFLKENEIPAVNLQKVFEKNKSENIYLKTDTHWTPVGARLAAMYVESSIAYNFPYLAWLNQPYKSKKVDTVKYEGDLMRYTVKGDMAEKFSLEIDQFYKWSTTLEDSEGEGANGSQSSDDLFGDVSLPITLVGTSYSANKRWNFEGFLKSILGTDILNIADEGLGPFEVMDAYLKSDAYLNTAPKLVIWEMPERYLSMNNKTVKEND